jgi:hypothetical protein
VLILINDMSSKLTTAALHAGDISHRDMNEQRSITARATQRAQPSLEQLARGRLETLDDQRAGRRPPCESRPPPLS